MISRLQVSIVGALISAFAIYSYVGEQEQRPALGAPQQLDPQLSALARLVPGAAYRPISERSAARVDEPRTHVSAPESVDHDFHTQAILVLGPQGEAVGAARVELERGSSGAVFSDAAGRTSLQVADSTTGDRLHVRAVGYGDAVVDFEAPSMTPLVVQLAYGGSVSGGVQWSDGTAAQADTVVLAWRRGQTPALDEVLRVREGGRSAALQVARTDALGRFSLNGLQSEVDYELGALREGGLALRRLRDVRVGDTEVQLFMQHVVGAALELVDADGGALQTSDQLFSGTAMWDPNSRALDPVAMPQESVEFAWIGGRDLWTAARGGRDHYLMLYEQRDPNALEPAGGTFSIAVPGYQPAWTSFALKPLSDEWQTQELALLREQTCLAALEFVLEGAEGWLPTRHLAAQRTFGILRLQSLDHTSGFEIGLLPTDDGRWNFDAVPCGRYELSLTLRDWASVLPAPDAAPVIVDISPTGGSARLSAGNRGAGEIIIAQADGADYQGEVVIQISQGEPVSFLRFDRPPYVIGGLSEGEYEVSVQRVGATPAVGTPSAQLLLAANTVSACMIHLR